MTSWISPYEPVRAPAGSRPTHLLRTTFRATGSGTLRITAHGVYEAHLNGQRVGDHELTPGYTEYGKRLQVQSFEVSFQGTNELIVELSDGWYRGQVGLFRSSDQWGERTALWAEIDGIVETGSHWESAQTNHLADMIEGETVDLREQPLVWHPVEVVEHRTDFVVSDAPPVRRIEEIVPTITARGDDWIVDLGQNITGWLRLTNLGPRDTHLTLTYGEELGPDGDVTQVNLVPNVPFLPHPLSAGQVDHVISDGSRGFEPRHSTKGFRYVRISGAVEKPNAVGVVVHTDLVRTGTFSSSHADLNKLHDAAVWSFRGNVVDIPTDCPTRERAGWTGDWQIYIPTAAYLYDVAGFSTKWLKDLAATQWENGVVPNMAPAPRSEVLEGPAADANGSAGWGDAAVIVPWEQYLAYGDSTVLEDNWPMMVRWIDFVRSAAEGARHPLRQGAEEPHEQYLWDTGFHWGEWLEPMRAGEDVDFPALLAADKGDVATAFYRRSTYLMSRIARILGKPDDYGALTELVRGAWQAEYVNRDGTVRPNTQATCVRALAFDLVNDRAAVADQLVRLVREADTHLTTGFLATPDLLPMLADHGHPDVAFDLLLQRTWPSWLGMIDAGATTIWERWEGWTADGQPHESHNHFSKGAVIGFLHRYVAGIRPISPGYERFELRPVPGPLTHARGALDTRHGRIESSWTIDGGSFILDAVVPKGTTCLATLPDGSTHELTPGHHNLRSTP